MTNDDNFNTHLLGLRSALHELASKWGLVHQISPRLGNAAGPPEEVFERINQWATALKSVWDESVSDEYSRIAAHADSLLPAADDQRLLALVAQIGKLTSDENGDLRDLMSQLEAISGLGDVMVWFLKLDAAARRRQYSFGACRLSP